MQTKAIGYLRVSKDDGVWGIDAQKDAISLWAARQGVQIDRWCVDEGVSGGAPPEERKGLIEALAACEADEVSLLVVAKRDRIARDVFISCTVERILRGCGCELVSANGEGSGDTPADQFMRRILDAAAEYERALIRARTKAALEARKARGLAVGRLPYHKTHPDEYERILELRQMQFSYNSIARELTRANVKPPRGDEWHITTIRRILVDGENAAKLNSVEG